jgi:hypothetical protein
MGQQAKPLRRGSLKRKNQVAVNAKTEEQLARSETSICSCLAGIARQSALITELRSQGLATLVAEGALATLQTCQKIHEQLRDNARVSIARSHQFSGL